VLVADAFARVALGIHHRRRHLEDFMPRPTIRCYLRPIKHQASRSAILRELKRKGFRFGPMNNGVREMLQDAIFAVENELEGTVGECDPNRLSPKMKKRKEWVRQMRQARNAVLDDLGWNENAARPALVQ
jgi:hypothetical protein